MAAAINSKLEEMQLAVERLKNWIRNWPWSSFLTPIWAVAMIIRATFMLIMPDAYTSVPAYEVVFNIAPWWFWAPTLIVVSVLVLSKPKNPTWQILQGVLALMEAVAIFFASIGSAAVSPTAGLTLAAIALALWLALFRNVTRTPTPYDKQPDVKK